jgi:hypothetical protein
LRLFQAHPVRYMMYRGLWIPDATEMRELSSKRAKTDPHGDIEKLAILKAETHDTSVDPKVQGTKGGIS